MHKIVDFEECVWKGISTSCHCIASNQTLQEYEWLDAEIRAKVYRLTAVWRRKGQSKMHFLKISWGNNLIYTTFELRRNCTI